LVVYKMGKCPLCGEDIRTNQRTAHRLLDGKTVRIHFYHIQEEQE